MKKLSELYEGYPDIDITGIKINSKEIQKGDIFVCTMGVTADRHDFVNDAVNNGASAIVASKKIDVDVPVVYVDNTNVELPRLVRKYYDYPDKKLNIIAITGTNGKTTTAQIIQDLIGNDICGYIGTNGIICSKFNEKIRNTTPDSDRLYMYFDRFVKSGCKYLSMEASSEAFYRNRLNNLKFNVGILTNITEDHLNIHKTIDNYVSCKQQLFKQVDDNGFSILNSDDKYFESTKNIANGKILTYGKCNSDLKIVDIKEAINSTNIKLMYNGNYYDVVSPLKGEFNVYNLCAAFLALIALGYDINDVISYVPRISVPHGRAEFLNFGQDFNILLDYAHTTDAFAKIYDWLERVKTNRIITITGSAGGREKEKRAYMGKLVLEKSDYVIFTMDDPRNEDVNDIIDDLVSISDKRNYERIIDREEAIFKALDMAKEGDIVLVAGKGCDNYMAVGDEYVPYLDYDVIKRYFENKNNTQLIGVCNNQAVALLVQRFFNEYGRCAFMTANDYIQYNSCIKNMSGEHYKYISILYSDCLNTINYDINVITDENDFKANINACRYLVLNENINQNLYTDLNCNIIRYGIHTDCDFYIHDIIQKKDGIVFDLDVSNHTYHINTPFNNIDNIYYLTAVLACLGCYHLNIDEILSNLYSIINEINLYVN